MHIKARYITNFNNNTIQISNAENGIQQVLQSKVVNTQLGEHDPKFCRKKINLQLHSNQNA